MFKVLKMLIFMFTFYFILQLGFVFLGNGHEISYSIEKDKTEVAVKEMYVQNKKDEKTGYYLEIKYQDVVFPFQIYENMNRSKKIIKDVEIYQDENYTCILPIFRDDKLIVDIMCNKNNVITYYHNMNIKNEKFDTYLSEIAKYNYDPLKFKNNLEGIEKKNYADLYTQNIQKDYYGALTFYRGIYTINNETTDLLNRIILFDNGDVYDQYISGFIKNNFIIADYSDKESIKRFIVLNYKSNGQKKIEISETGEKEKEMSYNSYVQGVHGNSLFVFDRDNKMQYEINIEADKVISNNIENAYYYENGKKKKMDPNSTEDVYFINDKKVDYENDRYYRIDKNGNKLTGYYYLFKKNNNKIDIYRMNVQNKDIVTYITTANEVRDVKYIDDYIYFIDGENINFYSDRSGLKTLLKVKELNFNKTIKYDIYRK